METKSIMKRAVIRSKPLARNFVRALENAENKHSKEVIADKTVYEIEGEMLYKIFVEGLEGFTGDIFENGREQGSQQEREAL